MPPRTEPLLTGPRAERLPVGYLPSIGFRSYRAVESALTAAPTLFDPGVELTGGLVEADWAIGVEDEVGHATFSSAVSRLRGDERAAGPL